MKKILLSLLFVLCAVPLMAQTQAPRTTLGAAIADGQTDLVTLASSTSVVIANGQVINTMLIVDYEAMQVRDLVSNSGCSTNCVYRVTRGYRSARLPHRNSAFVWVVAPNHVYDNFLRGQCNPQAVDFPRFVIAAPGNGSSNEVRYESCTQDQISNSTSVGVWKEQTAIGESIPLIQVCTVPVGNVAYASLGTATTTVAGSSYVTDVFVPFTQSFTGVKMLALTAGTDKWIGAVWDSTGNLLANSAVAGISTASSGTFQTLAFTASYVLTGPARYFIGIQSNGTSDTTSRITANTFPDHIQQVGAGVTFGTLLNITPPTTLGSGGANGCLY